MPGDTAKALNSDISFFALSSLLFLLLHLGRTSIWGGGGGSLEDGLRRTCCCRLVILTWGLSQREGQSWKSDVNGNVHMGLHYAFYILSQVVTS